MPVTEKKKKIRLYKVAKEFNLSHDTLIEFLAKKGYEIKNHMSSVDDEMLALVEHHYKKEKVDAQRHARKRKEYDEEDRRRRGDDEPEEAADAPAVDAPAAEVTVTTGPDLEAPVSEPETVTVPEMDETPVPVEIPEPELPVSTETAEGTPVEDVVEPAEIEATEEGSETAAVAEEEVILEAGQEEEAVQEVEEKKPAKKGARKGISIESSMPKMGLKVMGKIDLAAQEKEEKERKEKEDAKGKKDATDDKPRHKKKKKKRITDLKTEDGKTDPLASRLQRKTKKGRGREVNQTEVKDAIKRTKAAMGDYGPVSQRSAMRRKKRARREEEQQKEVERTEREKSVLKIYEYATVSELASLMNVPVGEVISSLIKLGVMASINQRLDIDTITLVASEFNFEIRQDEKFEGDALEDLEDDEDTLRSRPPIVTIMGHVDHGKTSLLDYIRDSSVVAGESGGITQHIGAYTVSLDSGRRITFLDTPGHEAFTAMRARGAQATDIVVLVVSADDNVMPQTVEAISHAQAAEVPIVIAINKIDKAESDPERIKQQLAERNILVEDWGGKYGSIHISAKKGQNIDQLLDRILLEADILALTANPDREARGIVIESLLDKGKGVVATILVQKGTLRVGDSFVAGNEYGKVRALLDERDNPVDNIPPSTPVQVVGFNGSPQAGDTFVGVNGDREAREIATVRQQIKRESDFRSVRRQTLDDISAQIKIGGVQNLSLIVKGDVDGSVEALSDSFEKLSNEEVRVDVIHKGVGAISESDVLLASASNAIIIGFHVHPNLNARRLAETELVDIRLYDIIYAATDDVKQALEGMLRPEITEKITGTLVVRDIFKVSRVGTIAGCYVQDGKISRNSRIRLLRDGISVFNGTIASLKRFKEDVREVDTNFECGLSLDGFNDIKVDDTIEVFEQVETKRSL